MGLARSEGGTRSSRSLSGTVTLVRHPFYSSTNAGRARSTVRSSCGSACLGEDGVASSFARRDANEQDERSPAPRRRHEVGRAERRDEGSSEPLACGSDSGRERVRVPAAGCHRQVERGWGPRRDGRDGRPGVPRTRARAARAAARSGPRRAPLRRLPGGGSRLPQRAPRPSPRAGTLHPGRSAPPGPDRPLLTRYRLERKLRSGARQLPELARLQPPQTPPRAAPLPYPPAWSLRRSPPPPPARSPRRPGARPLGRSDGQERRGNGSGRLGLPPRGSRAAHGSVPPSRTGPA